MGIQEILKTLKTMKGNRLCTASTELNQKLSEIVSAVGSSAADTGLNPAILQQILSNPDLKTSKCLDLFNFLRENRTLFSFQPNLRAHLTLACRLLNSRKFADAENLLASVSVHGSPRYPFSAITSTVEDCSFEPKASARLFNSILKVYSDRNMFQDVSVAFEYMRNHGIKFEERTCTVHLIALMRSDRMVSALEFFYRMVGSGIRVSVYSLTVVVNGLCRHGEIRSGRELVEEMMQLQRGLRPNIITCNVLIQACVKRWHFGQLDEVLVLMERAGVALNDTSYKLLIDGYLSSGKIESAERMVWEMQDKGMEVGTYLYTSIVDGYCRSGNTPSAISMLCGMTEKGVKVNCNAYWTLISSLCRSGDMEGVQTFVNEMLHRGIEWDKAAFGATIDGLCKEGRKDEACRLLSIMDTCGFSI